MIRQYITIDQRMKGGDGGDKAANGDADGAYDDEDSKNDDHKADEKVRSTLIQMKLSVVIF